mmetsp:Transcript_116164/g.189202  ORF Transcript_116164/g.189202 Transcript_116164/m.189202 type:complete len:337 (-) Transcript_116164:83-1093(-)
MAYIHISLIFICVLNAPLGASVPSSGQVEEADVSDEVSLLQASLIPKPSSQTLEAAAVDEGRQKVDAIMEQMQIAWAENAFWSKNLSGTPPGCGLATPAELQMPIPLWQEKNPGVDGFCFFSNIAFWFPAGEPAPTDVPFDYYSWKNYWKDSDYGVLRDKPSTWSRESHQFCANYGAKDGPEVEISYDGIGFTWTHVRDCIDVVDDPYCYSLGWLKGQNLDDVMKLRNMTAMNAKAKSECENIQDEFRFVDEEVTVGRHVASTPVYFRKAWCSLDGDCPGVTRRIHKEHVYTKCQIGAESGHYAANEMSYCYHKACVLEGNRVGHSSECKYDEDDD